MEYATDAEIATARSQIARLSEALNQVLFG